MLQLVKPGDDEGMPTKPESLAELVRRRMKELNDLSTYDVARLSRGRVSNGTVWNILNERVRDVKADTLKALARALQVSEEELHGAARGVALSDPKETRSARMLSYMKTLPQNRQEDLLMLARAFYESEGRKEKGPEVDKRVSKSRRRTA